MVDAGYSCGGNLSALSCLCNSNTLLYNMSTFGCNVNCASVQYAAGLMNMSVNACYCINGYYWDLVSLKCVINCSLINNTVSIVNGVVDQCSCLS